MSDSASGTGDIFDVRRIRRLVQLMNAHDLTEIDLRDGNVRVRLRKGYDPTQIRYEPAVLASQVGSPVKGVPAAAPVGDDAHLTVIKSIMVGTFFTSPSPDAPAFVKVGDHVGPDTTICIIEAMKVFNEIPAGVAGQIVAVLVSNGDPVEYGQPLFKVDTRQ